MFTLVDGVMFAVCIQRYRQAPKVFLVTLVPGVRTIRTFLQVSEADLDSAAIPFPMDVVGTTTIRIDMKVKPSLSWVNIARSVTPWIFLVRDSIRPIQ